MAPPGSRGSLTPPARRSGGAQHSGVGPVGGCGLCGRCAFYVPGGCVLEDDRPSVTHLQLTHSRRVHSRHRQTLVTCVSEMLCLRCDRLERQTSRSGLFNTSRSWRVAPGLACPARERVPPPSRPFGVRSVCFESPPALGVTCAGTLPLGVSRKTARLGPDRTGSASGRARPRRWPGPRAGTANRAGPDAVATRSVSAPRQAAVWRRPDTRLRDSEGRFLISRVDRNFQALKNLYLPRTLCSASFCTLIFLRTWR